jgi:hypothetical protein
VTGAALRTLAAAAVIVLAFATPASDAYVARGPAWPYETVTYSSQTPSYTASIDRAARLINRAHVGVRVVRDDDDPDVTFVYRGRACDGAAYVGFRRRRASTVWLGSGCGRDLITLTAVHELGHVLGLDHENGRCARMNPTFDDSGTPGRCRRRPISYWLAHPLTTDDVRGLRALY